MKLYNNNQENRKEAHITNWGIKKNTTTEPKDIKKIREYYEQLHTNKFNNSDETDNSLKKELLKTDIRRNENC